LVTGGGSGIGRMITEGFVANGAKVYICSRKKGTIQKAADALTKRGPGECIAFSADLSTYEGCVNVAKEMSSREKHLDVLVHNSGNNWGAPFEEYPDAAWNRVLGLNLHRPFTLTQKLFPLLKKSPSPRIIHIGSISAIGVPGLETYAYSASKAGLHHLSQVLAVRLGKEGFTVNTIACGPFESKMMKETLDKFGDIIKSNIPLGRIGRKNDIAGVCIFLSSEAGSYVNGATIVCDGGSVLNNESKL